MGTAWIIRLCQSPGLEEAKARAPRKGRTIAFLRFSSGAVQSILARFPDVFNDTGEAVSAHSFVLPDSALQIL